jgi:hypothetical protein
MSSTTSKSKATTLASLQAIIAGTQKHLPSATITLGNVPYATSSLVALFQSVVDAMAAQTAAQASAKAAVATTRGAQAKADPLLLAYRRYLLTTFDTATTTLVDFGLESSKTPTPLTADQMVAKKTKAAATRAARGTTSKKQKLAVKGNVAGVTVTPITLQVAPSPSAGTTSPTTTPAPTGGTSK